MNYELPDDLRMIQRTVREFVEKELVPLERTVPEGDDLPEEVRVSLEEKTKELGLWAFDAPEEYGGGGFSHFASMVILEEISRTSVLPSRSRSIFGGYNGSVLYHCNDEQKQKYLIPVINGKKRTCFALTEPDAGSDPASMRTTAVREGDYWVINGTKTFISSADKADFVQVFAITDPEKRARGGVSCFLVDRGTPGMEIRQNIELMIPDRPCEIVFRNCRVHQDQLVGGEGNGFELSKKWITIGRLHHGPKAVGMAQRALEMMINHSKQRVTFGRPLAERQAIQWMIADSAVDIHATRLMVYDCAKKLDQGKDVFHEAAMIKLFADEMAFRVLDRAIQVFGGMGLSKELPLERMFRDIRSRRITEGASEIQRFIIARNLLRGYVPVQP